MLAAWLAWRGEARLARQRRLLLRAADRSLRVRADALNLQMAAHTVTAWRFEARLSQELRRNGRQEAELSRNVELWRSRALEALGSTVGAYNLGAVPLPASASMPSAVASAIAPQRVDRTLRSDDAMMSATGEAALEILKHPTIVHSPSNSSRVVRMSSVTSASEVSSSVERAGDRSHHQRHSYKPSARTQRSSTGNAHTGAGFGGSAPSSASAPLGNRSNPREKNNSYFGVAAGPRGRFVPKGGTSCLPSYSDSSIAAAPLADAQMRASPQSASACRMQPSQNPECGSGTGGTESPRLVANCSLVAKSSGPLCIDSDRGERTSDLSPLAVDRELCDLGQRTPVVRGPERLYYDTSTYTGCHRFGGPSVVDRENSSRNIPAAFWTGDLRAERGAGMSSGSCLTPAAPPLGCVTPNRGGGATMRSSPNGGKVGGAKECNSDAPDSGSKSRIAKLQRRASMV